ncbi:unnamed protein product [Brassica oleracea var. botrytis]
MSFTPLHRTQSCKFASSYWCTLHCIAALRRANIDPAVVEEVFF